LAPALDFAGEQLTGLDQLRQTWTAISGIQAKVIAQILFRADAQCCHGMQQQSALGLRLINPWLRKNRRGITRSGKS
jgi:hypothetical protein